MHICSGAIIQLKSICYSLLLILCHGTLLSQKTDPYKPDYNPPADQPGMTLVWSDEFNYTGKPDTSSRICEKGFVRNRELQWYQPENAYCSDGVLLILGKKKRIKNPAYVSPEFLQPHYILLNLALGANGGDPSGSAFPVKYEVDYVRVYQAK